MEQDRLDFWFDKWKTKQIGFHQAEVNPYLKKYIQEFKAQKRQCAEFRPAVFVPLCGKTKDMLFLYENGFNVVGVELSEIACKEFFEESHLSYEVIEDEYGQKIFQESLGHIKIYCCDYFKLKMRQHQFQFWYDRASIVALNEEERIKFFKKTNTFLSANCYGLILLFEYDQNKMQGPPFSVTEENLSNALKLYSIRTQKVESIPIQFEREEEIVKAQCLVYEIRR